MKDDEILKIIAVLPDISGLKAITQLVSHPQKYAYLNSPSWDFVEYVNSDFVSGAVLEHGFKDIQEEIIFKYNDRSKVLSNFLQSID